MRGQQQHATHTQQPYVYSSSREVSSLTVVFLHQELIKYVAEKCADDKQAAVAILEADGFHIGSRLVERLSLKSPRVWDQRECVKFVCKDVWHVIFQKQADRLQTNRRGGYVIQDKSLPWLRRVPKVGGSLSAGLGSEAGGSQREYTHTPYSATGGASSLCEGAYGDSDTPHTLSRNPKAVPQSNKSDELTPLLLNPNIHTAIICGIIRGALSNLGLTCTVTADVSNSPFCSFQIRISSGSN